MRNKVLVFDVNETLLDINVLAPFFASYFKDQKILKEWFSEVILYSEALSLSGEYVSFENLADAILKMVAEIHEIQLAPETIVKFKEKLLGMKAHDDVIPSLTLLKKAGFRMVALTNSSLKSGEAAIEKADLNSFFEEIISVEQVQKYKPSQEVYKYTSKILDIPPKNLRLVACHTWDIIGARAAGYSGALITRTGNAPLVIGGQADIIEKDLKKVANRIIARDK